MADYYSAIEEYDALLDFENNIRMGFVVSPSCKSQTLDYIACIQDCCSKVERIWSFGG